MKHAMLRRLKEFLSDRRGGPLAELAMVVPLLLLLVFGVMEFGSLLYQQHTITKGVQEAARYAARSPDLRTAGTCPPSGAGWTGTVTKAQNIAVRDGISGALLLPGFTAATVTISVQCRNAAGLVSPVPLANAIPVVRVTANVPAGSLGFFGLLGLDPFNLTANHEEMGIGW